MGRVHCVHCKQGERRGNAFRVAFSEGSDAGARASQLSYDLIAPTEFQFGSLRSLEDEVFSTGGFLQFQNRVEVAPGGPVFRVETQGLLELCRCLVQLPFPHQRHPEVEVTPGKLGL